MIIIKTKEEIEILRECGRCLAKVLHAVKKKVTPGVSTKELDTYANELIAKMGDTPAFLNYRPHGVKRPFPASLCVSVNEEVVHGIPKESKILREGDIVSIDLGLNHKGLFTDMAMTIPVGKVNSSSVKLIEITEGAMLAGVEAAMPGGRVGDIGYAVESFVRKNKKNKYGIVEVLAGHGVGRAIHEDPFIPNFGKKGTGDKLVPGMVIAIEPMLNNGTKDVTLLSDEYTFVTDDKKKSAHFEHTVLITENGPEILTQI